MPSLLDMVTGYNPVTSLLMANRGQQQAAPQQQQRGPDPQLRLPPPPLLGPQSQQAGGVGGALGRALSGADDPRLSAEQNAEARRNAFINAGLATLANGGGGARGFQRVAGAMLASRQIGLQERAQMLQESMAARQQGYEMQQEEAVRQFRGQVMDNFNIEDPTERARAMSLMLENNDFEGANTLLEFEKAFPKQEVAKAGDNVIGVFNPRTGEITKIEGLPEPPKDTQIVTEGRYIRLMDKQTGEVISKIDTWGDGLSPEQQARMANENADRIFTRASTLRDDWRADAGAFAAAIQDGVAALQGPADAANDQALITAFNKLLDADSVVREGEYNRALEIGGTLARLQGLKNKWFGKGELPEEVRQTVRQEMQRLLQVRRDNLREINNFYGSTAQAFGVDPNWVMREVPEIPGVGTPAPNRPLAAQDASAIDNDFSGLIGG